MINSVSKISLGATLLYALLLAFVGSSYADESHGITPSDIAQKHKLSVSALLNKPKIKAALTTLEAANEQNLRDLITLTEIPAPPFEEERRAKHFASMLKEAGLKDVDIDAVGNVIGHRKGVVGARTIAIVAHIDTVFPAETDVTVKIEGDRLTAPGIGDNTRGMVVLLSILRALEAHDIQTTDNIMFVGSVGEEGLGDLRGVKYLLRDGAEPIDEFIAIDGGDAGRLIYKAVGSSRYRVTFKGPGGHSWGAFGMAHPHHALARAIEHFTNAAPEITNVGDKTSFSVGRIGGGTSVNSIPFESWLELDMRSANQAKLKEIDRLFQNKVALALSEENAAKKHGPDLTVDIQQIGYRPAGETEVNSSLVQNAMAAMQALGVTPQLSASSTDANIPISKNIPAITLSRGGKSGGSHSPQEWWENTESHQALHIVLLTLMSQAGYVN